MKIPTVQDVANQLTKGQIISSGYFYRYRIGGSSQWRQSPMMGDLETLEGFIKYEIAQGHEVECFKRPYNGNIEKINL